MWNVLINFSAWAATVLYVAAVLLTIGFWIWMTWRVRHKKRTRTTTPFSMPQGKQNQHPAARL